MKALNVKSILTVLFFAVVAMVSCKKNNDDILPPAATIEGQWVGKYGSGNQEPSSFYSFNILPNGKLEVLKADKTVIGVGTWKMEGEQTFKAEYHYNGILIYYNLAAKYDAAAKTLIGSWGDGKTIADQGEFYLNKQ